MADLALPPSTPPSKKKLVIMSLATSPVRLPSEIDPSDVSDDESFNSAINEGGEGEEGEHSKE